MNEFSNLPIIDLPGSDRWRYGYEWGTALAERFPDADAESFGSACVYNDFGPTKDHPITLLEMLKEGQNDEHEWIWRVTVDGFEPYIAVGGCDYTGWDCQSYLHWYQLMEGNDVAA